MNAVLPSRKQLGQRLRELRRAAGLNGVEFSAAAAALANTRKWQQSKTTRIEHGDRSPSEDDLLIWCLVCDAELALPDLIALLRNINAQWAEWKRVAASGHTARQRRSVDRLRNARFLRTYSNLLIPGLLQTEPYARAVLRRCIDFLDTYDDLDDAVAARMARQQARAANGRLTYVVLIDEAALYTRVGDADTTGDQLRHLLDTAFATPRMVCGVVPLDSELIYTTTTFDLWDQHTALVETITAELSITTPSELVYYEKVWAALHQQARFGDAAKATIRAAHEHAVLP